MRKIVTSRHGNDQETNRILVAKLKECATRKGVADLFGKYNIVDFSSRIKLLRSAMGDPETFNSEELTEDSQYQREVSMLLTKTWKLIDFYEKAGL